MIYSTLKFHSVGDTHTLNPRTSCTANDIITLLPERDKLRKSTIAKWRTFFDLLNSNFLFYEKGAALVLNTENKRLDLMLPTNGTIKDGLTFAIALLKKMPTSAKRKYNNLKRLWRMEVLIGSYSILIKFDAVTAATLGAINIKRKKKKVSKPDV